ncbi:MAG: competence protein ComEA [Granulosicoccus sp.]|jgi:competence protein ComEA
MFLSQLSTYFSHRIILNLLLSTLMVGFSAASIAAPQKPVKPTTVNIAKATKATKVNKVKTPIGQTVNINTGSAEAISASLKGIGLKKAQAIIEWRKANGAFTSIAQLTEVKGIGEKTLMANKDKIKL